MHPMPLDCHCYGQYHGNPPRPHPPAPALNFVSRLIASKRFAPCKQKLLNWCYSTPPASPASPLLSSSPDAFCLLASKSFALASPVPPAPLHSCCFVQPPRLSSPLLSSSPHAFCLLAPKSCATCSCAACNRRTPSPSELVLLCAARLASHPPAHVRALPSASCLLAPVLFAPCKPMPLIWYCFVSPPCCCPPSPFPELLSLQSPLTHSSEWAPHPPHPHPPAIASY